MKAALLSLTLLLTASGCPTETPQKPAEDTSDESVLQFHKVGQLKYGTWYEPPDGNAACRWRVEAKPTGDDAKPKVLASGGGGDLFRIPVELPGKDVFLRFNKACGTFQEVKR